MTNRNYYTPSNYTDHTRYGGEITNYHYDGHPTITDIAEEIARDRKFDETCRRNLKAQERGGQSAFFTVKNRFKEK